jgi:hypothetical protein
MANKPRARIHALKGGAIFLETPYDEFVLAQIKTLIPTEGRKFMVPPEGPGKGWRISAEWAHVGEHLVREAFPGAIDEIDVNGEIIIRAPDGRRMRQESLF